MNEITIKENFKVWVIREVLWRDLDALGHMNNVTALYYFEDARVEYFRDLVHGIKSKDWNSILARVECDYIGQGFMGEKLVVAIKVQEIRNKSFTFEYLISELELSRVVCRGKSVSVCFNYHDQETCQVPDDLVGYLENREGRKIDHMENG